MGQRRSVELLNDYDCEICYHPGKANVIADTLSRKERVKLHCVRVQSDIQTHILEAQCTCVTQGKMCTELPHNLEFELETKDNGLLYLINRLWVLKQDNLHTLLMNKAHKTRYFIHPGTYKIVMGDFPLIYPD